MDESRPLKERKSRLFPLLPFFIAALAVGGIVAGVILLPGGRELLPFIEEGEPSVSRDVYPATLVEHLDKPANGEWKEPAAIAVLGDDLFVLDTGNDRILRLDASGEVAKVLDRSVDPRLDLQSPMAIASDGERLYVANSLASEIIVLDARGKVHKVIQLKKVKETDEKPPRPIGIAVRDDGKILVADADNHRVLSLDQDGKLVKAVGTGKRDGGESGFNVPGGLAIDAEANTYVVDILNGRVVKLSPDGAFLQQFGEPGDTAGSFSRPKDVTVNSLGYVFASDGLLSAVEVFAPDGTYVGLVGRQDPSDEESAPLFQAPAGMALEGDQLYVVDRFLGLFIFHIEELTLTPVPTP